MSVRENSGTGLRKHERRSGDQTFLTLIGQGDAPPVEAAEAIFSGIAAARARGLYPFTEQIHGPVAEREAILARRDAIFRAAGIDATTPFAFVDGKPSEIRAPVSVRLWGLTAEAESASPVETVESPLGGRGRLLTAPGLRLLWLPGITGLDDDGRLVEGAAAQAERLFANAEGALLTLGFSYLDVVRTWIYARRLLEWYDELNRVRNTFHRECGITGPAGAHPFPASTGIQGHSAGEECCLDLLAVQLEGRGAASRPLVESRRQKQSFAYGSAFSRGYELRWGRGQTVLLSGTASIGTDGNTLYPTDPEAQVMQTLLSVGALLDTCGAGLEDICSGALYVRDAAAARSFDDVTRLLGLTELPLSTMVADVCRPDLALEIEAVVTIQRAGAPGSAREGET